MRRLLVFAFMGCALWLVSVDAFAADNIWYSVFVPGWGQVRSGHYGRGSLFLSTEIAALSTVALTDIQYRRTVDQYDRARAAYLHATYIGDAFQEYNLMHKKWNEADRMYGYRTAAIGVAAGVWAVNLLDMILFEGTGEPLLSFEARPGGFLVVGSHAF